MVLCLAGRGWHLERHAHQASISAVTPSDLWAVIVMAQELSLHEGNPPAELTVDGLSEVMLGPHPLLFGRIARIEEGIVGYAIWTLGYTMQYGRPLLEVTDLYVRSGFRRRGIARALMRGMADVALERGCRFMTVKTFADNLEANAFYPACGGQIDRTNVYDFGQRAMAALMVEMNGTRT